MALNLANTVTITAKTAYANVTTVSSNVLTNAANSGQIHKINNVTLTNYKAETITANLYINRSNTGNFYLAGGLYVPGNSVLNVIGKDTSIYLEEGDTLQVNTQANSAIHMSIGYELLS
jgi:hypothetical protein